MIFVLIHNCRISNKSIIVQNNEDVDNSLVESDNGTVIFQEIRALFVKIAIRLCVLTKDDLLRELTFFR